MQKSHISLIKELVGRIAGKNTEPIVDIIAVNKPVNEFKIADKLGLTINQTRNILYKLSAHSIVSFVRKKDAKKGWYIYSWAIDITKALSKFVEHKKKEIKNYEGLLHSRQTKGFYICPSEHMETSEENAMLYNFKCPECGQLLQPEAFEKEITGLKSNIEIAQKEVAEIEVELEKMQSKSVAKKQKVIEKERAEKLAARKKKAARKKAEIKKEKPSVKKKSKKKEKKKKAKLKKNSKKSKGRK